MYVPRHFSEEDRTRIRRLIAENDFATLVCSDDAGLQVSHLPLLFEEGKGESGVLLGHMARANPHWRTLVEAEDVLAIFHGPHAYVSPTWYQPGPAVPTWNYAVVHVHGRAQLMHEPAQLKSLLARLVERHERGRNPPWRIDLPADYEAKMLAAIVGFEITITRIEAKYKLSQNRSAADRLGVIAALETSQFDVDRQLARLMDELESEKTS